MAIEVGSAEEDAQRAAFRRRVLDRLATFGRRAALAHAEAFKLLPDL
jgi:hypothetical protein